MTIKDYVKRIPDAVLPDDKHKDGEIIYGEDLNSTNMVVKAGVNANFDDIQKILDGETLAVLTPTRDVQFLRLTNQNILEVSKDGVLWSTIYATGPAGPPGAGVIPGGASNSILIKKSNQNYDTEWSSVGVDDLVTEIRLETVIEQINNILLTKLEKKVFAVVFFANGWVTSTSGNSFTQQVTNPEFKELYNPQIVLDTALDEVTKINQINNMFIKEIDMHDGFATAFCVQKPAIDLTLLLIVDDVPTTTMLPLALKVPKNG